MKRQLAMYACMCVFAYLILLIANPAGVAAHARLVRSAPADKAELDQPPAQVELWFDELIDKGFNKVEVFRASEIKAKDRKNLARGDLQVDPKDRTHVIVPLQPLPAGEYTVEWRVLSRDGHSAPGRFTFRVKGK